MVGLTLAGRVHAFHIIRGLCNRDQVNVVVSKLWNVECRSRLLARRDQSRARLVSCDFRLPPALPRSAKTPAPTCQDHAALDGERAIRAGLYFRKGLPTLTGRNAQNSRDSAPRQTSPPFSRSRGARLPSDITLLSLTLLSRKQTLSATPLLLTSTSLLAFPIGKHPRTHHLSPRIHFLASLEVASTNISRWTLRPRPKQVSLAAFATRDAHSY